MDRLRRDLQRGLDAQLGLRAVHGGGPRRLRPGAAARLRPALVHGRRDEDGRAGRRRDHGPGHQPGAAQDERPAAAVRLVALPAPAADDRPLPRRLPRRQARVPAHRRRARSSTSSTSTRPRASAVKWGEMGWILETNRAMNRGMEAMGGRVVKRYRMYERALRAPTPADPPAGPTSDAPSVPTAGRSLATDVRARAAAGREPRSSTPSPVGSRRRVPAPGPAAARRCAVVARRPPSPPRFVAGAATLRWSRAARPPRRGCAARRRPRGLGRSSPRARSSSTSTCVAAAPTRRAVARRPPAVGVEVRRARPAVPRCAARPAACDGASLAALPRRGSLRRARAARASGCTSRRRSSRVAQPAARPGRARRARAETADVAEEAIARMRFALGVDDDLRPFYERFRYDPLIGRSRARARRTCASAAGRSRSRRWPGRSASSSSSSSARPRSSAGSCAGCGRRCARTGLRDVPAAAAPGRRGAGAAARPAASAPAARWRCAAPRARSRAAASTCRAPTTSAAGARLRAIPGIGALDVEMLALHGQGRYDQLPAGDLAYLQLRRPPADRRPARAGDRGRGARALRALRAVGGLAGAHALARSGAGALRARPPAAWRPCGSPSPRPGRNSFVSARASPAAA